MDWFNEMPQLSKSYALAVVACAACISYGIDISFMALDWTKVVKGFQARPLLALHNEQCSINRSVRCLCNVDGQRSGHASSFQPRSLQCMQIWRLLTHIFIAGKLGFPLLFNVIWILTYGATLEKSYYSNFPEDYVFMFLFGAAAMAGLAAVTGPILGIVYIPISGLSIIMMIIYIWSKEYPEQVSLRSSDLASSRMPSLVCNTV